ncbi:MAG: CynX/NimT family MFS transporter [Nitrospinota bacterium]
MSVQNRWFLLAIAWCVALNLRGISIAVSPILPLIKADLGLSFAWAGFLFAVPTVLMSLFGFPGGWLADRFGMKRTITLGLGMILAGGALRATAPGFVSLTIWTALLGAGMGVSGPGLTRMVKDRFADLPGTATGIYTSGLVAGATLGSWLTFPYLFRWTGSWSGTFLVWSGLTLFVLLWWVFLAPSVEPSGGGPPRLSGIWRNKTVWKLNTIFLLQSLVFYSLTAWIPTYYHELGLELTTGTLILTVYIIMNLPSSLFIPYLSDRVGGTKCSLIVSSLVILPALLAMSFFPLASPWTYAVLMGLGMGGIFALSFVLPLEYAEPGMVGSVAGANLLVGYAGTFVGPYLMGLLRDLTASFTAGWLLVAATIAALAATAWSLPKKTV